MITSYKQLPVGLYIDICEASQDASMDELAKQVRILALLSGTTDDEILNMPIADYQRAVVASDFLQREYQPSGRCASSYKVGGYDLRPFADWTKMTAAQFIDYQTYAGKGTEPHIVEIVSVVLVPAGKKYGDGYDVADVQRAIRDNLSVADVLDIVAFFFLAVRRLSEGFPNLFEAPGAEDEGRDGEGDGAEAGAADGGTFAESWGWVYNLDRFASTIGCSWDAALEKPALEFLNVLAYIKDKTAWEEAEREKWQKLH